jgi:hypothetical protein
MSQTSVTTQIHQSLQVSLNLSAQVTFDALSTLYYLSDFIDLVFRKVISPYCFLYSCFRKDLTRFRCTDAENVG